MAVVNEQTVSGRKFRKLIDEKTRLWLRISFWTKADDVECDDGETAETKFANIAKTISDLATSFRDGVNKIFNKLKGLGFTPSQNSPDGICNAIQNMYDDRYNTGKEDGLEESGLKSLSISAIYESTSISSSTSPCIIEAKKDCKILLIVSALFTSGWDTDSVENSGAKIALYKFNSKAEAEASAGAPWSGNYTYTNEYSNKNAGINWGYDSNFTLNNNWDLNVKTGETILLYTSASHRWRPKNVNYKWLFYKY